ncbi:MAG: LacI family DNA-binding transcriptional regulator [Spirochaetia bacterium]|nr:LacI family DNA-binding transcriptional regulator [Spirochaetia bacterium]
MTTLVDIAREASVSLTTAASILRGDTKRFSQATIDSINATARRLGYIPNLFSRNLKKGRYGTILLLLDRVVPSGLLNRQVLSGFIDAAAARDYKIIPEQCDEADAVERTDLAFKKSLYYDGMIISFNNLSPDRAEAFERSVNRFQVPVLWYNLKLSHNAVYVDESGAAEKLGAGIAALGLRRWLYIGLAPDTDHYSAADRYEGIRAFAAAHPEIRLDQILLTKQEIMSADLSGWEETMRVKAAACAQFDAVIFSNPLYAPTWLHQLRDGERPRLFTVDSLPVGKGQLRLPGTENGWTEVRRQSVEWLLSRMANLKTGLREKSRVMNASVNLISRS